MRFPSSPSSPSGSTPNSPPNSPTKMKHRLPIANIFINNSTIGTNNVQLTSGDPKTHPNVAEGAQDKDKIPVEHTDRFVCAGGVNITTLLRITRIALMDHAERRLGANSVVNEQCVFSKIFIIILFAPFIHFPLLFFNPDGNALFQDQNPCRVERIKFRYVLELSTLFVS